MFWGELSERWKEIGDATAWWERGPLLAMAAVILLVGVYPAVVLDLLETSVVPIAERLAA